MRRRGSYDRSDYSMSSVYLEAAHFLMDEGAGNRPLSFQEIAQAVRRGSTIPEGDFLRAAYQIEGHEDKDRGAELLATEALRALRAARLVTEDEGGWRWVGNGRVDFKANGTKLPLVPREERERLAAHAQVEAQFITPELQLPKRTFNPDTPENKALIASLVAVGFDDSFRILVDKDGIVDGYQRAGACEYINEHGLRAEPIDWRDHTTTVSFQHGPVGNIERTGKQVRANIGTGLSDATRKALAKKLKIEGHTLREIAEALGTSVGTAWNDVHSGARSTTERASPRPALSDDEFVSLAMEQIEAHPEVSNNQIKNYLRAEGHRFTDTKAMPRIQRARSRLATDAPPPAPAPAPPRPEPVSEAPPASACPTCGRPL